MSESTAQKVLAHVGSLEGNRLPWESLWQELADVCHPRRNLITNKRPADSTPDRQSISNAFDGTAQRSNRILANGQAARITPMGARWFALRPPEELKKKPAAVRYYHECGEILARYLAASNFYNRAHEHYLDRGAFGVASTEIVGATNGRGLHFRSHPVGSYSIAHDGQDEVNTIARRYNLFPQQMLELFPETTPKDIREMIDDDKRKQTPCECIHLIRPRHDRNPTKTDSKNKPFESFHIYPKTHTVLAESGYDEFPVAVSRFEMWGDSPYGWSPAYHALPEATQANFLAQMKDTLVELAAFPRVLYGSNLKGDIDFRALGLTCWDPNIDKNPPQEWLTNGRYDIAKDDLQMKQRAIEEAFFVPLFNAIAQMDKSATATEVRAIVQESRELFHPIFANLVREFLRPILRRSFAILLRQGLLPQPPAAVIKMDELGASIDEPEIEFTSAMALALEQSSLANFTDVINTLGPIAAADPSVLDFIDTDVIGPAFFRYKGLEERFIRTPEEVDGIREARAQAQQMAQAREAASAVKDLGGPQGVAQIAAMDEDPTAGAI